MLTRREAGRRNFLLSLLLVTVSAQDLHVVGIDERSVKGFKVVGEQVQGLDVIQVRRLGDPPFTLTLFTEKVPSTQPLAPVPVPCACAVPLTGTLAENMRREAFHRATLIRHVFPVKRRRHAYNVLVQKRIERACQYVRHYRNWKAGMGGDGLRCGFAFHRRYEHFRCLCPVGVAPGAGANIRTGFRTVPSDYARSAVCHTVLYARSPRHRERCYQT